MYVQSQNTVKPNNFKARKPKVPNREDKIGYGYICLRGGGTLFLIIIT
jgi:hypothetical protein